MAFKNWAQRYIDGQLVSNISLILGLFTFYTLSQPATHIQRFTGSRSNRNYTANPLSDVNVSQFRNDSLLNTRVVYKLGQITDDTTWYFFLMWQLADEKSLVMFKKCNLCLLTVYGHDIRNDCQRTAQGLYPCRLSFSHDYYGIMNFYLGHSKQTACITYPMEISPLWCLRIFSGFPNPGIHFIWSSNAIWQCAEIS